MDHAKEAVQGARFQAKGKWYLAEDVDRFLEELTVRLAEDDREQAALSSRTQSLQEECQRLQGEADRLQKELAEQKAAPPAESRRQRCWELEAERDELIQDIKALLHFREEFRQAVQQDVEGILGQLDALSSQKLL